MAPAPAPQIGGTCDPRFDAVRDAFVGNFDERDELGASVCVIVDDRTAVDLWGGSMDGAATRPWEHDTLVNVFSIGKAMAATCAARLAGEGRLDPASRVADQWPEFAAAGKADITVAQLLSHQGGLPAVRAVLPEGAMFDWGRMTSALAAQEPWWRPGTAVGYHVNTFGFLVGEVVRRVTGRSMGTYFRDEIAGPLGADLHIGLAAAQDHRVAEMLFGLDAAPVVDRASLDDAQLMEFHAYFNPSGLSGAGVVNTRAWRAAEIPSTNAHGTARGVARVYQALVHGGSVDGIDIVSRRALDDAVTEQVAGEDLVLHRPARFGLGFQLTQPERPLGPNPSAFGHFGAGGSLGFCDPDAGVAFGYVMNRMGPRWQNPRNRALIDALYECLGGSPSSNG